MLGWLDSGKVGPRAFKSEAAHALAAEYIRRISRFSSCEALSLKKPFRKIQGAQLWICDRERGAEALSSEQLAARLERTMDSGVRELSIAIGGPDGFSEGDIKEMKPDFRWSFGPLTLPHEIALIVAAEQTYRAWTILRNLPYHSAH